METLPQLETSSYNNQILWLFISFTILYFFISRSFFPKILDILKQRDKYKESISLEQILINEKIQNIKNNIKIFLEKGRNQSKQILKNLYDQKFSLKSKFDEDSIFFIKKINDEFKSDIKNDFDLNKENIYNDYLQINHIFSKEFFDIFDEIDKKEIKENFEKIFSIQSRRFIKS
jgi:F0F1-type ATP synthase membrane subunit b/b'